MKAKKIISVLFVTLLFFTAVLPAGAEGKGMSDTPYAYPIQAGTPEWTALKTLQNKIAACQIPEDILKNMTTRALVETVRNYPLAVNIYAYDSIDIGYEKVKSQFNGLEELENRMRKEPATTMRILSGYADAVVKKSSSAEFKDCFMDTVKACLQKNAANKTEVGVAVQSAAAYVYTPNGTVVRNNSSLQLA